MDIYGSNKDLVSKYFSDVIVNLDKQFSPGMVSRIV